MFKFGFTVRHVIDDESPLAGLTMQDLIDGDASLTLSVSAQERSSLQSIFHVQVSFNVFFPFICEIVVDRVVW